MLLKVTEFVKYALFELLLQGIQRRQFKITDSLNSLHCTIPIAGLAADKLGSYGPAFHMTGGAFVVASLIPFVLRCKKSSGEEDAEHAQEPEYQSDHNEVRMDGPLKITQNSNDSTTTAVHDHTLFVSTI